MFGNRLGWSISAVIVLVTIWILYTLARQGAPTAATDLGRNAANYTVSFPANPSSMAPWMNQSFDPSPLYEEIISIYTADKHIYNASARFSSTRSVEAQRWGKMMDLLFKAGLSDRSMIFSDKLDRIIAYEPENLNLQSLRVAGNVAIKLGLLHQNEGDKQTAQKHFEAAFSLGCKLYGERLTLAELDLAQELLRDAALALSNLATAAGQTAKANVFAEFDKLRREYSIKHILPLLKAIQVSDPHVGDLRALAADAGDHAWRIEAVLALGRCRFSSLRFSDQQAANHTIESLTQSDDPRIRAAAAAAQNLTIEQFRRLR